MQAISFKGYETTTVKSNVRTKGVKKNSVNIKNRKAIVTSAHPTNYATDHRIVTGLLFASPEEIAEAVIKQGKGGNSRVKIKLKEPIGCTIISDNNAVSLVATKRIVSEKMAKILINRWVKKEPLKPSDSPGYIPLREIHLCFLDLARRFIRYSKGKK